MDFTGNRQKWTQVLFVCLFLPVLKKKKAETCWSRSKLPPSPSLLPQDSFCCGGHGQDGDSRGCFRCSCVCGPHPLHVRWMCECVCLWGGGLLTSEMILKKGQHHGLEVFLFFGGHSCHHESHGADVLQLHDGSASTEDRSEVVTFPQLHTSQT